MRSGPPLNSSSPPLVALKNARSGELVPASGDTTQPPPGKLTPVAASYWVRITSENVPGTVPSGRCSKSILQTMPPKRPGWQNAGAGGAGVAVRVTVAVGVPSGVSVVVGAMVVHIAVLLKSEKPSVAWRWPRTRYECVTPPGTGPSTYVVVFIGTRSISEKL